MTKVKWKELGHNMVLHIKGGHISYLPEAGYDESSKLLDTMGVLAGALAGDNIESRVGMDETAICFDGEYAILNGDFRKEYEKCKTIKEALKVFNKNIEHRSTWSTYQLTKK